MVCLEDLTAKNCLFFKGFQMYPSNKISQCLKPVKVVVFFNCFSCLFSCLAVLPPEFDFFIQQRFPASLIRESVFKNITNVTNSLHQGTIRLVEFC